MVKACTARMGSFFPRVSELREDPQGEDKKGKRSLLLFLDGLIPQASEEALLGLSMSLGS